MINNTKYTQIKFLSNGLMGMVYLVKDNETGKQYALKEEFISGYDDRYLQTELDFVTEVASKYPEQFIQLVDIKYIDNCQADTPSLRDWLTDHEKQWLINLRQSSICVQKVYTLIDTSLDKLPLGDMTLKQRYSMLIQVMYIKYLFEKYSYVHGDFHFANIGVKFVDQNTTVSIFGTDVPTYGFQYVAIDYGGILHKDTASEYHLYQQRDITEKQHFHEHWNVDKDGILAQLQDEKSWWNFIQDNQVRMEGYEHD